MGLLNLYSPVFEMLKNKIKYINLYMQSNTCKGIK